MAGQDEVTPCVGVWIEILVTIKFAFCTSVTPCVGVWIEISKLDNGARQELGHSLRGSVD